jgi:RimJ/RimL family protein N-acetyltransferase
MASIIAPAAGVQIGGKLPLPISTARLLVRRFRPDDSVKLLEMLAQDEATTLAVNESDVDQWIEQQRAASFYRSDSGIYLAIELLDGEELAGYVSIYYSDVSHTTAGFTLTITPPRRRQGLGLEATRAVLDFAFDGLCARRLAVSCASPNIAASGMLAKAGLRKEGEFVKSWFDGSAWVNVSWYALLKEERAAGV